MFRSVVCWHFTGAEKRRSLFFKHSPIVPFEQIFLLKGCIITLFHVPYSCIGIWRMKSLHWSYRANIWPYKGMLIIHERSPVMAPRIPISFLDLSMAANGAHTHTHTHKHTNTHTHTPLLTLACTLGRNCSCMLMLLTVCWYPIRMDVCNFGKHTFCKGYGSLTFLSHPSSETFAQPAGAALVSFVFVHNALPAKPEKER